MAKGIRRSLPGNFRPLLPLMILMTISFISKSQTYSPSSHVVVNDAVAPAQATPIDSRSMFYDATNFVYRPYQNISEVKSYLNLSKYRTGNFIIVIDSGGALQPNGTYFGGFNTFWMFKDGTADGNLVEMSLFGPNSCSGCLLAANNLSDLGNLTTALTNLNLNNVNNTSDATKNSATATLTNKQISGLTNTLTNIPNSALLNTSIGLGITNFSASDISVTSSPAALGTSLGINIPTASGSQRGALSATDWVTFNGKQNPITVTVVGTSGPATLIGSVLNIPQYTAGTGCINCNADSLKHLPVDTSANRNSYVLTFDSTNHKWYLSPNGSGTGITQLTGDGTAGPGSGSQVFTLATVNGSVGTFGNASSVAQVTLNGKGLATAAGSVAIQIAESQVTGLVSDLAGKIGTTLTSANILVGNGSNVAAPVAMSGDVGISNTGLTTIQANAVATSKINNNAVTLAKMATNTANTLLGYDVSGNAADISVGNLNPLFTTSFGSGTLNFTFSTVASYSVFGNLTGSTTSALNFGKVPIQALGNSSPNTLVGYDGSGAVTNVSLTLAYAQNALNNTLSITDGNTATFLIANATHAGLIDSAHYHYLDSLFLGLKLFNLFPVNGLASLGSSHDSIGIGGTLYQNTTISGSNAEAFILDSMHAATGHGFKINFGSDAGWDLFTRDSATGFMTRIPKGTPGQSLTMLLSGGIGWGAGGGGGTPALTQNRVGVGNSSNLLSASGSDMTYDPTVPRLSLTNFKVGDSVIRGGLLNVETFAHSSIPAYLQMVNATTTATWTGSWLDITGGTNNTNDYIQIRNHTGLTRRIDSVIFVQEDSTSSSYGIAFGVQSTSSTFLYSIYAFLDMRAATRGQISLLENQNIAGTSIASNLIPLIINNGDTIIGELQRVDNNFIVTETDKRTGVKATATYFLPGAQGYDNNSGEERIWFVGGHQHIIYWSKKTEEKVGSNLMVLGDSWSSQYDASSLNFGYLGLAFSSRDDYERNGGAGEATLDALADTSEIITLAPKNVLINLLVNDAQESVALGTFSTRYQLLCNTLTAHGITVTLTTEGPNNNVDVTPYVDTVLAIGTRLGLNTINTAAQLFATGSTHINPLYNGGDGVHLNNAGHFVLYGMIFSAAPYLLPTQTQVTTINTGGSASQYDDWIRVDKKGRLKRSTIRDLASLGTANTWALPNTQTGSFSVPASGYFQGVSILTPSITATANNQLMTAALDSPAMGSGSFTGVAMWTRQMYGYVRGGDHLCVACAATTPKTDALYVNGVETVNGNLNVGGSNLVLSNTANTISGPAGVLWLYNASFGNVRLQCTSTGTWQLGQLQLGAGGNIGLAGYINKTWWMGTPVITTTQAATGNYGKATFYVDTTGSTVQRSLDLQGKLKIGITAAGSSSDSVLMLLTGDTTVGKIAITRLGALIGSVGSVGSFSGSSQTNGASISGNTITFGPADGTNPGMIQASGSQTLGATITFTNSPIVPTASPGDNSTKAASTAYVDALHTVSGTWTPTVTTGTNVSAGSGNACYYSRVGNVVTFSGSVNATITLAASASVVNISLPVSSTFTSITDANGTLGANSALSLNPQNLVANTGTGNTMQINFGSGSSTGGYIIYFSGQYLVH